MLCEQNGERATNKCDIEKPRETKREREKKTTAKHVAAKQVHVVSQKAFMNVHFHFLTFRETEGNRAREHTPTLNRLFFSAFPLVAISRTIV